MPDTLEIPSLEALVAEVQAQEASFGELDLSDLRKELREALKTKRQAEVGETEYPPYCYVVEVFQSFIVTGEDDEKYTTRHYKRPYSVSGTAVSVGERQMEVELAWVPALVKAREAVGEEITEEVVTEQAIEAVQRGEPTQEAIACSAPTIVAHEATDAFMEASFQTGVIEGIIPIRPGTSINRKHYPESVLSRDYGIFNGMPVFMDHQDPKQPKPLKNVIGVLENARWDSDAKVPRADLRYPQACEAVIEEIKQKHALFGPESVGFSIDMPVKAKIDRVGGQLVHSVEALIGGPKASTDVVWRPAAGGSFDHALEAAQGSDLEMLEGMTLEQIKAARPDLFNATEAEPAAQPAPQVDSTVVSREAVGEIVSDAVSKAVELAERRIAFSQRVAGSKLPQRAREAVMAEAASKQFETQACESILEGWLNDVAANVGEPEVKVPAGDLTVTESVDVAKARLLGAALNVDQEVNGSKVRRFTSLRESILAFHPAMSRDAIYNPSRFARESMGLLHWGGGELGEAVQAREAVSSTTFNLAWADVMNKVMLREIADPRLNVWREIVSDIVPFSDLTNTKKFLQVGDYPDIAQVAEGAPYQPITTPGERKVEFGIDKYGNTESYTWESALADDLRVLAQIPRKLARAWAWTVYRFVFSLLTDNSGDGVTMDYDAKTLYHVDHANNTDAAFSVANLITADGLMRDQSDITQTSNPKLFEPRFLLYASATALRLAVWEALQSSFKLTASSAEINLPNFVRDRLGLEPIEVHYPDGSSTRCELVANPQDVPTLAVGFLNGNEAPELFVQDMERVGSVFNADKITYKIRGTLGADVLDHRSFSRIDK